MIRNAIFLLHTLSLLQSIMTFLYADTYKNHSCIQHNQTQQDYQKMQGYQKMIEKREKFFIESLVQPYDSSKVRVDITSKLHYIDFCSYPPDRSLPYGSLKNGRFHGTKVNNLPFTCNQSSGARKIFIKDSTLSQAYGIVRFHYPQLTFLIQNLPSQTCTIDLDSQKQEATHYIWERYNNNKQNYEVFFDTFIQNADRLWVIHNQNTQKSILIFHAKGKDTEVIIQYIGIRS